MSGATVSDFSGLHRALNPTEEWEKPDQGEIDDDRDGEAETLPAQEPGDAAPMIIDEVEIDDEMDQDQMAELQSSLLNVSKGVTDGTDAEYRRYRIDFIDLHRNIFLTSCLQV